MSDTCPENNPSNCLNVRAALGNRAGAGRQYLCLLLVSGTLLLGLVFPFSVGGRMWSEIFDLGHAPLFFLLLLVIVGFLDPPIVGLPAFGRTVLPMRPGRVAGLCGVAAVIGIAGETLQKFTGRHASLSDVAANCAGLLAGFLWICGCLPAARYGRSCKLLCLVVLVGVSVVPVLEILDCFEQLRGFPVLNSFERSREISGWSTHDAGIKRSEEWATDGSFSLKVELRPALYSGADMIWPTADWTGFKTLRVDVCNPNSQELRLMIKIQDSAHPASGYDPADRFERECRIAAGAGHTLQISLLDIAAAPVTRRMRLDRIARIEFFCIDVRQPAFLFLDNLRLE